MDCVGGGWEVEIFQGGAGAGSAGGCLSVVDVPLIISDKFQQSIVYVNVEVLQIQVHRHSGGLFRCAAVQKTGDIPQLQFLDKVYDTRCCTMTGGLVDRMLSAGYGGDEGFFGLFQVIFRAPPGCPGVERHFTKPSMAKSSSSSSKDVDTDTLSEWPHKKQPQTKNNQQPTTNNQQPTNNPPTTHHPPTHHSLGVADPLDVGTGAQ